MKKLLFILIPLAVIFGIAYSLRPMDSKLNKKSSRGALNNVVENEDVKITMNTDKADYNLGVREIELDIINFGNNEFGFGEYYTVEKHVNGTWYEVPFKDNTGFRDILHVLKPNESSNEKIKTSLMKYSFTVGKYRIIKEFYYNGEKIELAAEFNIK